MAVDLTDLVESLERSVSPPDEDLYANVTDQQWVGYLADAFWSARVEAGLFSGYFINENDEIEPESPTDPDLSRDQQQIIVLYATLSIITQSIRNTNTLFRAKAGPAEFETQNSATALKDVLAELQRRRDMVLTRLSDMGAAGDMIVDLTLSVNDSLEYGDSYWISG